MTGKPTVEELGIDVGAQAWQRSGGEAGSIEIAFVGVGEPGADEWVLMRVAGDPAGRVLVYDRNEWECFLDGVKNGEFDNSKRPVESIKVTSRAPKNDVRVIPERTTANFVIHNLGSAILKRRPCQGGAPDE